MITRRGFFGALAGVAGGATVARQAESECQAPVCVVNTTVTATEHEAVYRMLSDRLLRDLTRNTHGARERLLRALS